MAGACHLTYEFVLLSYRHITTKEVKYAQVVVAFLCVCSLMILCLVQPEVPGRYVAFDHVTFWVGNAKQVT